MSGSPLDQFIVKPIIPIELAGFDISFSQSALWMAIGVILSTMLMTFSVRSKKLIPGRWQNLAEMTYEFVFGMVEENLGKESKKYFPFVFSVFMIVLMGNLLGMVPYSFTYTSHIIVTGSLALAVFFLATLVGIIRHGLHFFTLFLPKGLPLALAPLIIMIEVISYCSRPISLSVRLFANMLAGHTMVKVFAGFSVMLGASLGAGLGYSLGILPMALNIALYGLEIMIALIQAYVFTILTCIYLKDAIELH